MVGGRRRNPRAHQGADVKIGPAARNSFSRMLGSWFGIAGIPPDTRLAGSTPCLIVGVHRDQHLALDMAALIRDFGRWPFAGRSCVVRGRRSKASQGGNRGQEGAPVRSGATYGDLRIADGSRVSPQGPVARNLGGGNDDDERVRSRGCAALARARRSKED